MADLIKSSIPGNNPGIGTFFILSHPSQLFPACHTRVRLPYQTKMNNYGKERLPHRYGRGNL